MGEERKQLHQLINYFQEESAKHISSRKDIEVVKSFTPIQAVIVPGNENVRKLAQQLFEANLDIRPILYPTVPKGKERLRVVLHSFNTVEEVQGLIDAIFF